MRETPQVPQGAAERRQLTVLFCDLVGSTHLSEQLDPEDFRELIQGYQDAAAEVIARYGGHIAQYLGDGLLVYFGYPAAHEDDAERAVRAAYDILRAIRQIKGRSLQARVGVHTGTVVVGRMGASGHQETLAVGEATNLAARLQSAAEPDTVVISHATLQLVPGMFITRDLGEQALKGVDKPMRLHQVLQPSGVRSRLEAAAHLTPFVGRQQELALLNERWEQAREGQGQAVLLTAEPGIGKSRLLLTFREQAKDRAHSWLDCRCSPLHSNSAFAPTIELLSRGLQLRPDDSNEFRLQRLERTLELVGFDRMEAVPLLAPLLNLSLPKPYAPSPYGPELKRRKVFDLLTGIILVLARQQPLLLAIEDMHWADPSSVDLLNLLIERLPGNNVMVLFTARPEFQPNWPMRPHQLVLALSPLRGRDSGQMLASLTGGRELPAPVQERLLQRSGGVPLFLEEITRSLLESGQLHEVEGRLELAGRLEDLAIPATLQDSLTARIDRLGEARQLVQVCAVAGREIPYRLLAHVAGIAEDTLQAQLAALTGAQLLYARGTPPEGSYLFKHALIQDTAYQSLLRSTRQKLHGIIAEALEQHFPERRKAEPEVLAAHLEKAGRIEPAVRYYKLAGAAAAARVAATEAIAFLEKALGLAAQLDEGAPRRRLELALLTALIPWIGIARGYGHPAALALLERARGLLGPTEDPLTDGIVLGYSHIAYHFSGQYEQALRIAGQAVARARAAGTPVNERNGLGGAALTCFQLGRFGESLAYSERALALETDPATDRLYATVSGVESRMTALMYRAWSRWFAGYPDDALALARAAQARAESLGVPMATCVAVAFGLPVVLRLRREWRELVEVCRPAVAMCERYGNTDGYWYAQVNLGVGVGMLGEVDEGLEIMRKALAARAGTGRIVGVAVEYSDMSKLCLEAGRPREAREAFAEARRWSSSGGELLLKPELFRIEGELLLAEGAPAQQAEACFREAIDTARGQGARSVELGAAISLARLWQGQGRGAEALGILRPLYDAFTEGFDTPMLTDARALLAALGAAPSARRPPAQGDRGVQLEQ